MAKKDRSRAPSDDEGVAAIVPASLKGLDDDTVLIVTSFLPECRDVLSLSVTRALPETAWRADVHGGQPPRQLSRPSGEYAWATDVSLY